MHMASDGCSSEECTLHQSSSQQGPFCEEKHGSQGVAPQHTEQGRQAPSEREGLNRAAHIQRVDLIDACLWKGKSRFFLQVGMLAVAVKRVASNTSDVTGDSQSVCWCCSVGANAEGKTLCGHCYQERWSAGCACTLPQNTFLFLFERWNK